MENQSHNPEQSENRPYFCCEGCNQKIIIDNINTVTTKYRVQPWFDNVIFECEDSECETINLRFLDQMKNIEVETLDEWSDPYMRNYCDDEVVQKYRRVLLGIHELQQRQLGYEEEARVASWGKFLQTITVTAEDIVKA